MNKTRTILTKFFFLFFFVFIINCSIFIAHCEAQPQWRVYTTQNSGLPDNVIVKVTFDSSGNIWIGTQYGGLAKFNGITWNVYDTANSSLPNQTIQNLVFENNILWICTYGGGIAKFDGTIWTIYDTLNSPLPENKTRFILIENNIKWIGTLKGLAKFDNVIWTIYNTTNSGLPSNQLWCGELEGTDKWIGTFSKGIAKYDNTNWSVYNFQNSGLPSDAIRGLAIDALGNKWFATMFEGVAKFNSNLNNWVIYNSSNSGLPDNNTLSILTQNHIKWIGTSAGGLAKYNDTSWTVFDPSNSPLLDGSIICLSMDQLGNLWIGTGYGLAEYNPNGIIGIKNESESLPEEFTLKQNYPNPFNPETLIEYELIKAAHVSLKIYDLKGSLVENLVNSFQKIGNYKIIFYPDNLPSGVYFYVMETESFKESKKMIYIK